MCTVTERRVCYCKSISPLAFDLTIYFYLYLQMMQAGNKRKTQAKLARARYKTVRKNDCTSVKCIFCSQTTLHNRVFSGRGVLADSTEETPENRYYTKCTECGRYACDRCVHKLCQKAGPKLWETDNWFHEMKYEFLPKQQLNISQCHQTVGSCCEWAVQRSAERNGLSSSDASSLPLDDPRSELFPDRLERELRQHKKQGRFTIDGMLFLPTVKLLIPCPPGVIDIHGFGEEKGHYDGTPHCVPSLGTCVLAARSGWKPKPLSECTTVVYERVTCPDIDPISGQIKRTKKVEYPRVRAWLLFACTLTFLVLSRLLLTFTVLMKRCPLT